MSFLAPWFLVAAAAAVSLPVLFHLFRRTPKGRLPFSTLMFLTPSPPRLPRRSRLENWPLLLLRALVLLLLGLTFGRPLWRQFVEESETVPAGRRVVVLVDTSASMRRGDLWDRALEQVRRLAETATPYDELNLTAFDSATRTLVSFEAWRKAPPAERAGLVQAALVGLQPGWSGTHLDDALLAAAEMLDAADQHRDTDDAERERRIVLVGDQQAGARTAGLQSHEWPAGIRVEVVTLSVPTSNVGLHALEKTAEHEAAGAAAIRPYVLLTAAADSNRESFTLAWKPAAAASTAGGATDDSASADPPTSVYVPPGKTRVVRAPPLPPGDAAQLVLLGDDEPFDNTLTLVTPVREQVRVLHLTNEKPDDPQSLRYFLERASAAVPGGRIVTVEAVDADRPDVRTPDEAELADVALFVIPGNRELPPGWSRTIAERMHAGAVVASVVEAASANAWHKLLPSELLDPARIQVAAAAASQEYALLGAIDLRHPIFAAFNDPRYSDFTKIRFWRHRRIVLDDAAQKHVRVAARFDSGDPAVLEVPRGAGRLVLFAAGWQPRESQLGVSSKFVPLVTTLIELGCGTPPVSTALTTGATIDLSRLDEVASAPSPAPSASASSASAPSATAPAPSASSAIPSSPPLRKLPPAGPWTVKTPDGREVRVAADAPQFSLAAGPGLYEVRSSAGLQRLAVNLPVDESKTAPLGNEALEALGIRLAATEAVPTADVVEEKRNLQLLELESRQQLWRWCLAAALGVVVVETWYAGRAARRELPAAA